MANDNKQGKPGDGGKQEGSKYDVEFLEGDELRGIRLELDYYQAEQQLKHYGINSTIVVFGSTRIVEPNAAMASVDKYKQEIQCDPASEQLQNKYAASKRLLEKSKYYEMAREFGRLVGASGRSPDDSRITLMTGGGPGIMEAANRGAEDVGAKSIGLNISLPNEQMPNPYIPKELCFSFHYFAIRKLHFMLRAKALAAFPGGYGTIDEIFSALTLIQTKKVSPLPIVLIGKDFWRNVFDVDFLVDEGVISKCDQTLFSYAESAREAWSSILSWHCDRGSDLFKGSCP